jgi:g-D-glutamyl-meso-diaminopimelate peptidase
MVNPDGVDLVIDGLQPGNPYGDDLIRWNNNSTDFSQNWEANIRGVDLNPTTTRHGKPPDRPGRRWGSRGRADAVLGPYPESEPKAAPWPILRAA